jgi:hypothetical protein
MTGLAVLHLDADRLAASLGEAGLVNHQDSLWIAQLYKYTAAQIITHQINIPNGTRKQALHPIGSGFSSMLGQVPAIFALAGTQQALKVYQGATTRFWPDKAGGNPGMEPGERLRPLHNLGRGRLGSIEGDMLGLLHDFLLSVGTSTVDIHTNRVSHLKLKIVKRFQGALK